MNVLEDGINFVLTCIILDTISQIVGSSYPTLPLGISHHLLVILPGKLSQFREEAKVCNHVTAMPVLSTTVAHIDRPTNNFLGQIIGSVSEGKYNTVDNTASGKVTFQKCMILGIAYWYIKK